MSFPTVFMFPTEQGAREVKGTPALFPLSDDAVVERIVDSFGRLPPPNRSPVIRRLTRKPSPGGHSPNPRASLSGGDGLARCPVPACLRRLSEFSRTRAET